MLQSKHLARYVIFERLLKAEVWPKHLSVYTTPSAEVFKLLLITFTYKVRYLYSINNFLYSIYLSIVSQDGAEPLFNRGHLHVLAGSVVVDLVLVNLANRKVFCVGVGKVQTTDTGSGLHRK